MIMSLMLFSIKGKQTSVDNLCKWNAVRLCFGNASKNIQPLQNTLCVLLQKDGNQCNVKVHQQQSQVKIF